VSATVHHLHPAQNAPSGVSTEEIGEPQRADGEIKAPARTPASGIVGRELRKRVHRLLIDHLDLAQLDRASMEDSDMRPQVMAALSRIVDALASEFAGDVDRPAFLAEMCDEVLGLGPLERLLADDSVSEVMVVDSDTIFCERGGKLELTPLRFTDADTARAVLERIVSPLGRRIDESNPYVDARLKDGSRVNAIIPPLALRGPCITIRKFSREALTLETLVGFGSLTEEMAGFLRRCVAAKKNILISGGTGSGKTTLLNALSAAISPSERIVTVEDAAELRLVQPHVVVLESRPPNMEGRGEVSIRDLVRNALRMRPDRILVGECRGGEALDMLQAMNTGHDGSMTTTHANNPSESLARLETLCLMAGLDLPSRAIREQISSSLDVVVQQSRLGDGSRRITCIAEVVGMGRGAEIDVRPIYEFSRTATAADGAVLGEFAATGYLPSFLAEFVALGLTRDGGLS